MSLTDLSFLSALTNLKSLSLSDNMIEDLTPLSEMTSLSSLYLSGNPVWDLSPLYNLTGLRYVSLYDTSCNEDEIEMLKEVLPDCYIY